MNEEAVKFVDPERDPPFWRMLLLLLPFRNEDYEIEGSADFLNEFSLFFLLASVIKLLVLIIIE